MIAQRLAVTPVTRLGVVYPLGTPEIEHPAITLLNEVFEGQVRHATVVDADPAGRNGLAHPVEKDQRNARVEQVAVIVDVVVLMGHRKDDPLDHVVLQHPEVAAFDLARPVRLGDQHAEPVLFGDVLYLGDDAREKRPREARHDDTDGLGPAAQQAQRTRIGLVMEFLGHLQHGLPGLGIHVETVGKGTRHSRFGYVQGIGYILDGNVSLHRLQNGLIGYSRRS